LREFGAGSDKQRDQDDVISGENPSPVT
jgi:hypothetical protein